ncbi:MAG: ABC transporter ATP-binding protein [Treponema sp.]
MVILEVQDISKYYGSGKKKQTGCEHISFTAESGGIYSLLGLNGAGKSTVLNIIGGYRRPSAGDVFVCGASIVDNPIDAKRNTGVLYEQNPLYDAMTVGEFLHFTLQMRGFAPYAQQEAIDEVVEFTDLQAVYTRRIKDLSKGYRQRVGLAQAIVHHPRLILLDEPASGLDPFQLRDFEKKILTLSTYSTVILCTHRLEMAERICSQHILLHQGHLIAQGTRAELAAGLFDDFGIEEDAASENLLLRVFEKYAGIESRAFRENCRAEP